MLRTRRGMDQSVGEHPVQISAMPVYVHGGIGLNEAADNFFCVGVSLIKRCCHGSYERGHPDKTTSWRKAG